MTMLRFETTPDDIFIAMLDSAITERLEVVLVFDDDSAEQQDAFECHLPRSSTVFTWQEAKQQEMVVPSAR
jgi:hypothetical protein